MIQRYGLNDRRSRGLIVQGMEDDNCLFLPHLIRGIKELRSRWIGEDALDVARQIPGRRNVERGRCRRILLSESYRDSTLLYSTRLNDYGTLKIFFFKERQRLCIIARVYKRCRKPNRTTVCHTRRRCRLQRAARFYGLTRR